MTSSSLSLSTNNNRPGNETKILTHAAQVMVAVYRLIFYHIFWRLNLFFLARLHGGEWMGLAHCSRNSWLGILCYIFQDEWIGRVWVGGCKKECEVWSGGMGMKGWNVECGMCRDGMYMVIKRNIPRELQLLFPAEIRSWVMIVRSVSVNELA